MTENPLLQLASYGQSIWLDQMRRSLLTTGELRRLVEQDGLRGVTSNPTIFEKAIAGSEWDLVILDEINYAISYGMLDPAKVAETLKQKPDMVHVILTGRNAHPTIVELADTVTEMRQVKHAYEKGVMAQRGIEY